ncbi:MAG TPA: hypothetical protein VER12_03270 [Polyangiaceae bacterium]|nr:hypothetical protein [Polyangiaceae bacterium]
MKQAGRASGLLALALGMGTSTVGAVPGPGVEPAPVRDSQKKLAEPATPGSTDDWTRHVSLSGGIALYFYQPTNGWQNQFLIYTNLRFDARWQPFGLHLEPRLSNEKMRPYYDGLAWVQEAYLFLDAKPIALKVGKIYKQLGLFWDGTFYGNIQVYEGLKLDPNAGVSLEGKLGATAGAAFWAQFFVVDGHTNASLLGRDTISIPGARRRNTLLLRIQPFLQLSETAKLEFGFSGEHFDADLPAGSNSVWRGAIDTKLTWATLGLWGEVLQQWGAHVDAFPYPGDAAAKPPVPARASARNTYLLAGAEYTFAPLTLRYNLSIARYSDVSVEEVLHVPGLGLKFNDNTSVLAEYAIWPRHSREGTSDVDQSLNLTWMGHF